MKTSITFTRRRFVRDTAAFTLAASVLPLRSAESSRLKAAVNGHTGRGDY
jgi:hypothetical protein